MTKGETTTVTFTFSEVPTGFDLADVTVENGALSAFTVTADPLVYTATYTPTDDLEDATNMISVGTGYTDAAGNTGTAAASANYTIDTLAPSVTITSDVSAVKIGETATITFTFSDDPVGTFADEDIATTGGTLSPISGTADPLVYTAIFTPTPGTASGTASITVADGSYTDAAGDAGTAGTTPAISIDTLAPTVAITLADSTLTKGETTTVTFTFSEVPTGFDLADVTVENGALSAFTVTADPLVYTATYTPTDDLEDATNMISVGTGYTDAAGNTGTAAASANYTINTLAPPPIELAAIAAGSGGFVINGQGASDNSGFSVASAGDVNGDGLADLIVGAPYDVATHPLSPARAQLRGVRPDRDHLH